MKRKLANGTAKENIEYCAQLLNTEYDPQKYHRDVLISFELCLITSDSKEFAIDILKENIEKFEEKYKKDKSYENEKMINYHTECVVDIYFRLFEIKKGIAYYNKHYIEKSKEVKEYILLSWLEEFKFYEEWIEEYEKR